jgi:hypothetical protein
MRSRISYLSTAAVLVVAAACSDTARAPSAPPANTSSASSASFNQGVGQGQGGPEVLSQAVIHRTVEAAHGRPGGGGGSVNLSYHGGVGGIGVETAPVIYLVVWGSQWNNNDPSGEVALLSNFYGAMGGSSWLNSVTQYCQGVPSGTVFCNGAGTAAGNPGAIFGGVWVDAGAAAPSRPSQSNLAAEAVRAAQHFGNLTSASNASVQYVIATATGNSSSGFKTQYCAYHSSTSSTVGNVAYTNLPYLTDAGASCGANFNGLGPLAGITIVSGHEAAETISDQFPNGGWLDSGGAENGDKCAWIATGSAGASANVSMGGSSFPVQSLWSNAANNKAGGCVLSYP